MTLGKMYPSLKQNYLLGMQSFFTLFLMLGLGGFIEIVGCLLYAQLESSLVVPYDQIVDTRL